MGWGKGKGKHWLPGPGVVAAEVAGAAIVGGLAGAAVASAVAPHPKHHPKWHHPPPPKEVVVINSGSAAEVIVVEAKPKPKPKPKPTPVVVVASSASQAPVVVMAKPAPKWKGKGKGHWKGKGKGYAPVVIVDQPALAISGVSLPAGADEMRGDTHYFAVDVLPEGGGGPWRVMRRYNEFHSLYDEVGHQAFPDAPFPRKHLFGILLKVDDRRRGLEVWLQRLIQHPSSKGPWARPLNDFLTAGRQVLATPAVAVASAVPAAARAEAPAAAPYTAAAIPSAPAVASEPATMPSAPPAATDAGPAAEEEHEMEDDGSVLAIEIPAGVSTGAVLAITVPDGKQVEFSIPDGKQSGDTLELWYDATSGTLTPLV